METVGIRELKSHLSEYVRRVREGERIWISSHGEVVAELRPPEDQAGDTPAGLRELVDRGLARRIVRNDPSIYRRFRRASTKMIAQELLDQERGDR